MRKFIITLVATAFVLNAGACLQEEEPIDSQEDQHVASADLLNTDVIDRMGRPEITNFLVRLPPLKVGYNAADSFGLSWYKKQHYRNLISLGISAWDKYDGKEDWHLFSHQSDLSRTFVNDFLIVDTSIACSVNTPSFFEIELAPVGEHQTCGGRTPNTDVIDILVTLLVAGPDSEDVFGDGVDGVPRPAVDTFPYLVAPHATPVSDDGDDA